MVKNDVKRGKTGKGYKITSVSTRYAKANNHGRHYLALFQKDQFTTTDGWYTNNKSHARKDGENFINS
jgi:hypothetical protein